MPTTTPATTPTPETVTVSLAGLQVALEEVAKVYATKKELGEASLGDGVTFATEAEIRALFTTSEGTETV